MRRIRNFLNYYNVELLGLITVMILSIGFQSLFLALDPLPAFKGYGWFLDICCLMLIFGVTLYELLRRNSPMFPSKDARDKSIICIPAICLASACIYITITKPSIGYCWPTLVELAICLTLLLISWIVLKNAKVDTQLLGFYTGLSLLYCLGTYFAMLINGIEPKVSLVEIIIIAGAALIVWFKPCSE